MLQRMNNEHPSTCPSAKHSKTQQIAVTDMRETQVDFFNGTAQASTLALAIIFLI